MSRTIMLATALSAFVGVGAISIANADAQTQRNTYSAYSAYTQQSTPNRHTPGYTGSTVVPGDNSTISGDSSATRMQQTGAYGPG
jgi:hypothetical protein